MGRILCHIGYSGLIMFKYRCNNALQWVQVWLYLRFCCIANISFKIS